MPRLPRLVGTTGPRGRRRVLLVGLAMTVTMAAGCATAGDGSADIGAAASLQATDVPEPADAVTNGIDEVAPEEALAQARSALAEAVSFRVTGSPTPGQRLDLVFVTDAPGARGTVSQDGSTFALRAVDGAVYVRGDLDWLAEEVASGAPRTLGGKWLLLPDPVAQDLAALTDPTSFVEAALTPAGAAQSVGVSMIDEVPAAGIRFVDSEATVWLAGVGTPYPLLVERPGATADEGVVRFGEIDEPATLSAPRAANVVVAPESPAG